MKFVEDKIQAHYSNMSKKQRLISRYIIENMEDIGFLPLSKLAIKAKVSEASITRFCSALGYEGYADFQKEMRAWIKSRVTPLIKLKKSISEDYSENLYSKVINADIANLKFLGQKFPIKEIDSAVQSIVQAERVYVIGMRTSFASAALLDHYLNHIGISSELLDSQAGRLLDRAIHIGNKDVTIGISFPRYTKQTVEILQYAKTKHCNTIAITDNVLSPAVPFADIVITAEYQTPIPFHSYVSVLSIIHCLIFGISINKKEQSIDFMRDVEDILKKWDLIIAP